MPEYDNKTQAMTTSNRMTAFDDWRYQHADELLLTVAGINNHGDIEDIKALEIEFHLRAAWDGFSGKCYRLAISKMLIEAVNYCIWQSETGKCARELVDRPQTLHELRLRMMGKKVCQ